MNIVKEKDMAGNNLRDALVDEIKDLYNAEKQLTKALPKLAKGATSDELRDAFTSHLEETQGQIKRLERVFELLDEKPVGKHCAGIAGIIEEGNDTLKDGDPGAVLDACLIAGAQRAEHYEIGAYGTVIAWAEALELSEIAEILNETLAEEKAADEKLSAIAESGINEAATAGDTEEADMDEDDMAEDDEDETRATSEDQEAPGMSAKTAGQSNTAATRTRNRGGRR
jgi:ferritin-like metal-binding protein YciE